MRFYLTIIASIFLNSLVFGQQASGSKNSSAPYNWKSVQIVGGGFVDGIVFHPKIKDLRYCRTDMGGAYKWNAVSKRWDPLLDWISYEDNNLMGVESIAIDPANPERVYMACGTYTRSAGPNAILRSDNQGKTFERFDVPFKMGGNENGRGNGERLAVDPLNSNILYMGTRLDGLWKSTDRGSSWKKVNAFPDISEAANSGSVTTASARRFTTRGSGIVFVLFDTIRGTKTQNHTIYAGCSLMGRENLYKSTDNGETWQSVPGQPTSYRPTHAALAPDGTLYVTYGSNPGPDDMSDGGVWKFNTHNESWTDITPDKPDPEKQRGFGYAAVSVDALNPQTLIVSTYNRYNNKGGEDIFRSINGGKTWTSAIVGNSSFDNSLAPYVGHTGIHWLFDIEIDPFDSNHALFTTGYGGHETFNLSDADKKLPVKWQVMSTGIEETVALDLFSPSKGAHLISAIGDYGGFVHRNLDAPNPNGNFVNPHFGNTDGISGAAKNPDIMVRVGVASTQLGGGNIGYSLNAGKTWQTTTSVPKPESERGFISVSADGNTWLWTPSNSGVYRTTDKGASWILVKDLPANTKTIADPVNPSKFYALNLFDGKLFTSTNGGTSFSAEQFSLSGGLPKQGQWRGDMRGGQDRIYAAPGKENDLWLPAFDGLYHYDAANGFSKTNSVNEIHAFGFGKAAPGKKYAAMYLVGTVNQERGIFRSDDTGKTWVRINDNQHQWGLILHITGDPKLYGRVYVGTHGRGIFYGDSKMKIDKR